MSDLFDDVIKYISLIINIFKNYQSIYKHK